MGHRYESVCWCGFGVVKRPISGGCLHQWSCHSPSKVGALFSPICNMVVWLGVHMPTMIRANRKPDRKSASVRMKVGWFDWIWRIKKEKCRLKSNKHRHSRAGGNDGGWVWGGGKVSGWLGKGSLKMGRPSERRIQTASPLVSRLLQVIN